MNSVENNMAYEEVRFVKSDIEAFRKSIKCYCDKEAFPCEQSDLDLYAFLSKHIIFFKNIYRKDDISVFCFKILASDLFYLISSLIRNEKKYAYLNTRAIIENYVRVFVQTKLEDNHITYELFYKMKDVARDSNFTINNDDFSKIRNLYKKSCQYIHSSSDVVDVLLDYWGNYINLSTKRFSGKKEFCSNLLDVIKCLDRVLICFYPEYISACFHGRKSLLEYLMGKDLLEILFERIK